MDDILILSAIGVVGISLAMILRLFRIKVLGNPPAPLDGPSPGADPDDLNADFSSAGIWFSVEVWPSLAPRLLFKPLQSGLGVPVYLLLGRPLLAILKRIDARTKVCVYRGKIFYPFMGLVHIEYFRNEQDALDRQRSLLADWQPGTFMSAERLKGPHVRSIRRRVG